MLHFLYDLARLCLSFSARVLSVRARATTQSESGTLIYSLLPFASLISSLIIPLLMTHAGLYVSDEKDGIDTTSVAVVAAATAATAAAAAAVVVVVRTELTLIDAVEKQETGGRN